MIRKKNLYLKTCCSILTAMVLTCGLIPTRTMATENQTETPVNEMPITTPDDSSTVANYNEDKSEWCLGSNLNYNITGDTTVGGTIEININLSSVVLLHSASIAFAYDTNLLEIESISAGDLFKDKECITDVNTTDNGKVSAELSLKNTEKSITGSGSIATIKAKVLNTGSIRLKTTNTTNNLSKNDSNIYVMLSNKLHIPLDYKSSQSDLIVLSDNTEEIPVTPETPINPETPDVQTILQPGVYQEDCSALSYTGTWFTATSSSYGEQHIKFSREIGSAVEFTFNGTTFEWYGTKANVRGAAKIIIDGNEVTTVDCYNYPSQYDQLLYRSSGLSNGIHTVKIVSINSKNPQSTCTDIDVDKVAIYDDNTSTTLQPGTYQDSDSKLNYIGNWYTATSDRYNENSIKVAKSAGSSVEFTFEGSAFEWYGTKANIRGSAKIYIDDKQVTTVDCYNYPSQYDQLLYRSYGLSYGTHKVKIVSTGSKNQASTSSDIDLDKIVILKDYNTTVLQPGTYQDDDAGLVYYGNWVTAASNNYDNGTIKVNKSTPASVEFTFNGSAFEWYGTRGNVRGAAKIYIDGKEITSLDCYGYPIQYNQLLFRSPVLSEGSHNVRIVSTNTKNPESNCTDIDIDKIVVLKDYTPTILQPGTYQDDNSALVYFGNWSKSSADYYDEGSIKVGKTAGSAVEFTFNGSAFEWYGTKSNLRGCAKIFIDGQEVTTIDCYTYPTEHNALLYRSDKLSEGTHTIRIVVTGTSESSAQKTELDIDKIVILKDSSSNILQPGAYQENNSSLMYSGNWATATSNNYEENYIKVAKTQGASVDFSFKGTSFEWYGIKGHIRGFANVYIDGNQVATIDCYNRFIQYNQLLYKSVQLSDTIHTVKIVASGLKNPSSSCIDIDVDRILIH